MGQLGDKRKSEMRAVSLPLVLRASGYYALTEADSHVHIAHDSNKCFTTQNDTLSDIGG